MKKKSLNLDLEIRSLSQMIYGGSKRGLKARKGKKIELPSGSDTKEAQLEPVNNGGQCPIGSHICVKCISWLIAPGDHP